MNTRLRNREQFISNLQSKAYRDAFVETHIRNGISFQIRSMREARAWSQKELATRTDTKQEAISRLENPDYGRFTLETLRRLASVFDVALIVRFAPFSKLLDHVNSLTPSDLNVAPFAHDDGITNYDKVENICSILNTHGNMYDHQSYVSSSMGGSALRSNG